MMPAVIFRIVSRPEALAATEWLTARATWTTRRPKARTFASYGEAATLATLMRLTDEHVHAAICEPPVTPRVPELHLPRRIDPRRVAELRREPADVL